MGRLNAKPQATTNKPSEAEMLAELKKMQKAWSSAKAKKEAADALLKEATDTIKRYVDAYPEALDGKSKNIGGVRIGYSRQTTYSVPTDKILALYQEYPVAVKFSLSTSGINALLRLEESEHDLKKVYKLKASEEVKFSITKA